MATVGHLRVIAARPASFAAVLEHHARLFEATGDRLLPVLSEDGAEADALLARHGLRPCAVDLSRAALERLVARVVPANAPSDGDGEVVVVEGDPAALVGVLLAGIRPRILRCVGAESLRAVQKAGAGRRFTLVASRAHVPLILVRALCDLATDAGCPAFSLLTGRDAEALSRLAVRPLLHRQPAAVRGCALFAEQEEVSLLAAAAPESVRVVGVPSPEALADSITDPELSTLSLSHHGRDFCGRFEGAALCCQGPSGQDEGRCVAGMTCFDRRWRRIEPRSVRAPLLLTNSCAVFKPQGSYFGIPTSLGLEYLDSDVCGLVTTPESSLTTPVEDLLFHALAAAGASLSEIASVLRRAAVERRSLVAVGDGDFRVCPRARLAARATAERMDANTWRVTLPRSPAPLVSIHAPELAAEVLARRVIPLLEGDDAEIRVGGVFAGGNPGEVLVFAPGAAGHTLQLLLRGHPLLAGIAAALEARTRAVRHLRRYFAVEPFALDDTDAETDRMRAVWSSLASSKAWWILPRTEVEELAAALARSTEAADEALLEVAGRRHCVESWQSDRLVEDDVRFDAPCPYCGDALREATSRSVDDPAFAVTTGQCLTCTLLHQRTTAGLEVTLSVAPVVSRRAAAEHSCSIVVTNRTGERVAGRLAVTTIPRLPDLAIECSPAQPFEVAPGETRAWPFSLVVPDAVPGNVYVLQATLAHDLRLDYARRPFLLAEVGS